MNKGIKLNYDQTYSSKYNKDYYRGRSFHYAGRWTVGARYVADEYNTDFVSYHNFILVCKRNHTATQENEPINYVYIDEEPKLNSKYWDLVIPATYTDLKYLVYGICQEKGNNPYKVMSQKVVTDELNSLQASLNEALFDTSRELSQIIEDTETGITTRYRSELYQTAQNIHASVTEEIRNASGMLTEAYESAIDMTSRQILATVTANKNDANGSILNLRSELLMTAEQIRSEVSRNFYDANGRIDTAFSTITQTADEITHYVEASVTDLNGTINRRYSELRQTADEITATVAANKLDTDGQIINLRSVLSQTAESILATVTANKVSADGSIAALQSELALTATEIRATVSNNKNDADGKITNLQSLLNLTATEIRAEVSRQVLDLNGSIDSARSEFRMTADSISTTVEHNKQELDGSISALHSELLQTAEEIRTTVTNDRTNANNNATLLQSQITQNANQIALRATKVELNTAKSELNTSISNLSLRTDGIEANVQANTSTLATHGSTLTNYYNWISEIEQQLDNEIDTWFYPYSPVTNTGTAQNPVWTLDTTVDPYATWLADEQQFGTEKVRDAHAGDIFYNTASGYGYRFTVTGASGSRVYGWSLITDSAVVDALRAAADAQTTADGKMRVFLTTPTPPYQPGDMWIKTRTVESASVKEAYTCITEKTVAQQFSDNDWIPAMDYATKVANANLKILADSIVGTVSAFTYNFDGTIDNASKSVISQKAGEIRLAVVTDAMLSGGAITSKFLDTGIDIIQHKITITADNIILQNNSGTRALTITNGPDNKPVIAASSLDVDNMYVKHLSGADGTFTGTLSAASGSFSGEITASSGTIGGSNGISISSNSVTLGSACTFNKGSLVGAINGNSNTTTIDGGNITTGTITATQIDATNLQVAAANITGTLTASQINGDNLAITNGTFSGSLSAATGSFSGTITASSGTIGGFTIGSTSLAAGGPGQLLYPIGYLLSYVYLGTSGDDAIRAGWLNNSPTEYPFRVTRQGELFATNAHITGAITATSLTLSSGATVSGLSTGNISGMDGYLDKSTYIQGGYIKTSYIKADELEVSAANIQGTLTASQINTTGLQVAAANITGTLSASQINTSGLTITSSQVSGLGSLATKNNIGTGDLDTTIISGGYIQTGLINASALSITASQISDLAQQGFLTQHQSLAGYMTESTYIQGGYIKTGYINADALTVKSVLVNSTNGGGIAVKDSSNNNLFTADASGVYVKGSIVATSGNFGGNDGVKITNSGITIGGSNGITIDTSGSTPTISFGSAANIPNPTMSDYMDKATYISNNKIVTSYIDADALTVKNVTVTNTNGGAISVTDSSNNVLFSASGAGVVVKGSITSSSGTIGGFTIGSTSLHSNAKPDLHTTNAAGVYLGTDGISLGAVSNGHSVFEVDSAGNLYATSATISGTITANRIVANSGLSTEASLAIKFGNAATTATTDPNTIYFLYN